jgi:hypothetical protein
MRSPTLDEEVVGPVALAAIVAVVLLAIGTTATTYEGRNWVCPSSLRMLTHQSWIAIDEMDTNGTPTGATDGPGAYYACRDKEQGIVEVVVPPATSHLS